MYTNTMRIVAHLDMDAFFASVEERDNPRLQGLPVVVGSDPLAGRGRGVVSTANYRAREYGIKSALPISEAWRLSESAYRKGMPRAVFLGVNGKKYNAVSERIYQTLSRHFDTVEIASIDEFYLDASALGNYRSAISECRNIQKIITEEENLSASIGLGPNKLIAKIASDYKKPHGLTEVRPEETELFLNMLPVRVIPGIGPKTELKLKGMGVHFIQDLRGVSLKDLVRHFGKCGADLYFKAQGIDESLVSNDHEVKSVGEQETFPEDTRDTAFVFDLVKGLTKTVIERMRSYGFSTYERVVITVRFADFETVSRSHTLDERESSLPALQFEALRMLTPFFDTRENPERKLIRLVGVRVEKLN